MGLFDLLFGNSSNASKNYGPNAQVIENARAFRSMCEKIGELGKGGYGFFVFKEESSTGITEFYVKYTFHDVDDLSFAHKWMQEGKSSMVEYSYNSILEKVQLTPKEQGFFLQYPSDFREFLSGGIPNYNQCIKEGLYDITIIQNIGCCLPEEVLFTYSDIKYIMR